MKKITILLADDHAVLRHGLRALMVAEPDMEVVGEAETGRQAVELARKLRPAVAIIDIAMPGLNGLEATRQITREVPGTKVIILSSYGEDEYVAQLTEAGATGYLLKQTASSDLLKGIRDVSRGNPVFSPAISKRLLEYYRTAFSHGKPVKPTGVHLTSREIEVLQLIAEGKANKEIAADLGISAKTADKHRQHLKEKLNIHDIAGLTRYAMTKGIVENRVAVPLS